MIAQMAQEMKVRAARKSLIDFTEYTYPEYMTAKHHRLVAHHLERVERREIDRLMLLVPPRHGKSELASRRYPAWVLGRNPSRQIIAASAGEVFAADIGKDIRNIIQEPECQKVFPGLSLSEDSQAAGKWRTSKKGVFFAVGVGTQILGKGAHEFVIDDPFGSMEDAQSVGERRRVIEWYKGSVYNRLMPGGAIIVINHRLHEEDLSGYLLEMSKLGGDKWEVVDLRAIAEENDIMGREPGEALWPEAYPIEALQRIKTNQGPKYFSSMYQQNPVPDEGTYFKREWFQFYTLEQKPPKLNIYGSSDFAVTEGGGDFTEHAVWGLDADANIYCLDWWKGRTASAEWIERWIDLVEKHRPITWFSEAGVIRRAIEGQFMRRQNERRMWTAVEWLPSIADKGTRARGFQSLAGSKKVFFPKAAWAQEIIEQMIAFPNGKYDDSVDCCSLIGRAVEKMDPTPKMSEAKVVQMDRYSMLRRRMRQGAESYKTA